MKKNLMTLLVAAATCLALTSPALSVVLFDNGPIITHPGGMTAPVAGADRSALSPGSITFGFGAQSASGNRVAEDFTAGAPWSVSSVQFMTYQTGATSSSITSLDFRIWDGLPEAATSTLVYDSIAGGAGFATSLTNIYRTDGTSTSNTSRRIQQVDMSTPGLSLAAGTYWMDWGIAGTAASGPWQPPVSDPAFQPVGNALQQIGALTAWNPLDDNGVPPALPFVINGSIVPEPSSICLLLLGATTLLGLRRR